MSYRNYQEWLRTWCGTLNWYFTRGRGNQESPSFKKINQKKKNFLIIWCEHLSKEISLDEEFRVSDVSLHTAVFLSKADYTSGYKTSVQYILWRQCANLSWSFGVSWLLNVRNQFPYAQRRPHNTVTSVPFLLFFLKLNAQ